MKKVIFILMFLAIALGAERKVFLELHTATWCGPCAEMIPVIEQAWNTDSDKSILVALHSGANGDPFYSNEIGQRLTLYSNVPNLFLGFPTCYVDGLKEPPWPYTTSNIKNEIESRIAVKTPITIQLSGQNVAGKVRSQTASINYTAVINSENVIQSQDLKFILFVVESGIAYAAPNGMQVHEHVVRDIVPDQNGVSVDFSDANDLSITIEGSFDIDQSWDSENVVIVGIVQDLNTREVYQAEQITFVTLGVTEDNNTVILTDFKMDDLYPNPFNPSVNIPFSIAAESQISLQVINIIGKEVDTLIENKYYSPGNYTIQWNATAFPAGTYFIRMITPNGNKIQKAILLK